MSAAVNNPNMQLAIQRLEQFLKQLELMTEEQKKFCIESVDINNPGMLHHLYDTLNEYME